MWERCFPVQKMCIRDRLYTDLSNPRHKEDARAFFESNRAEMLEGTAVLWEEKNDYYSLMCKRVNIGPAAFNSEIQNNPIDPASCTFQEEWFDYWDDEGKVPPNFADPRFLLVGANDPSLGKNKRADTCLLYTSGRRERRAAADRRGADRARRHRERYAEADRRGQEGGRGAEQAIQRRDRAVGA